MIVWKTRPHLPAYVAYGAAADTLPRGLSNEKDIHEHLDTKNEPASVAEGYVESLLKETKPSNALKGFVDCEHHPQNWKKTTMLTREGISLKKLHKGISGGAQSDPSPVILTPLIRLTWYLAHIVKN